MNWEQVLSKFDEGDKKRVAKMLIEEEGVEVKDEVEIFDNEVVFAVAEEAVKTEKGWWLWIGKETTFVWKDGEFRFSVGRKPETYEGWPE